MRLIVKWIEMLIVMPLVALWGFILLLANNE